MNNEIVEKKKNNTNKILVAIIIILLLALGGLSYYTFFVRDKKVNKHNPVVEPTKPIDEEKINKIEFEKCDSDSCEYNFKINDKEYQLKYIKSNNSKVGVFYYSDIYLRKINNDNYIKIMSGENYTNMRILNDLLIFTYNKGGYSFWDNLNIYSIKSQKNIKIIEKLENYDFGPSSSNYYMGIKKNSLTIYDNKIQFVGTLWNYGMGYDGESSLCENTLTDIDFSKIDKTNPAEATYEITYDDLINEKEPTLVNTTILVGNILTNCN